MIGGSGAGSQSESDEVWCWQADCVRAGRGRGGAVAAAAAGSQWRGRMGPLRQGGGGAWALGAEGVGQALWKGTPERGCEQSWSREAPRLRGSASGVTDSGGPAESEEANGIP